jgi:hypothetical protein
VSSFKIVLNLCYDSDRGVCGPQTISCDVLSSLFRSEEGGGESRQGFSSKQFDLDLQQKMQQQVLPSGQERLHLFISPTLLKGTNSQLLGMLYVVAVIVRI